MAKSTPPAGRIILAATLLVIGVTLLVDTMFGHHFWGTVWRLWPLLPIALGLELLYRSWRACRQEGEPGRLAVDSTAVTLLALLVVAGFIATPVYRLSVAVRQGLRSMADRMNEAVIVRSFEEKIDNLEGIGKFEFTNPRGVVYLRSGTAGEPITIEVDILHPIGTPASLDTRALEARVDVHRTTGAIAAELMLPGAAGAPGDLFAECRIWVPAELDVGVVSGFGTVELVGLAGDVRVQNGVGEVTITDVSGNVWCENNAGSVTIENPGASVEASVSTGRLELVAREAPGGDYTLTTHRGILRLTLPEGSDARIEALAQAGGINTNLPLRVQRTGISSRAEGVMGEGRVNIYLRTSVGSIDVTGR